MDVPKIEKTAAVITYIEAHLTEKLNLSAIADAAGYSKYHLHRMFTSTTGLTPHAYIQRRQLTLSAQQLVYTQKPIVEIALHAGYDSQQAFTTAFKTMYKQTPTEYRQNGLYYPLQLAYKLKETPNITPQKISSATPNDLPDWKKFIPHIIDGFPRLEEQSHLQQVKQSIAQGQTLIMRDGAAIIGAAAFSPKTSRIDFLAVHPQYRRSGITKAFLDRITEKLPPNRAVSITTFRAGDKADTGQRAEYKNLGFTDAELLTEFGYPTQRLILPPKSEKRING